MSDAVSPPITTEADALADVLQGGLLAGTPADFARAGKTFRAAMNARDDSEQLRVDLALVAVSQFRQVARGLMGDPFAPALLKVQVEAARLLDRSLVHLAALRLRKASGLDVPRPSPEALRKRARDEAARDCATPDRDWRESLPMDRPECVGREGHIYPVLRGTGQKAVSLLDDLARGWPMERFFLEHPTLTAADVRAIRGCWAEIGCVIDPPEPPEPDYRHVARYDLSACVYGRGLEKEEVRLLEYGEEARAYLRTEEGARKAWKWKGDFLRANGIEPDLDKLAGFHVPSPDEWDAAAEARKASEDTTPG